MPWTPWRPLGGAEIVRPVADWMAGVEDSFCVWLNAFRQSAVSSDPESPMLRERDSLTGAVALKHAIRDLLMVWTGLGEVWG